MGDSNSAYYFTDYTQQFRNDNGDISYSYVAKLPTTVNDFEQTEKPILSLQVNGRLYPSDKDYIIDLTFPVEVSGNVVPSYVLDPEYLNGFVSVKNETKVARYGMKRLYNVDTSTLSLFILKRKYCSLVKIQGKERSIKNSVPFSIDITIKDSTCICCRESTNSGIYCTNECYACGGGLCTAEEVIYPFCSNCTNCVSNTCNNQTGAQCS